MLNDTDDATGDDGRLATVNEAVRRRRWSAAEKAAVVRETLVPGARVFLTWPGVGRWIRSRSTGGGTMTV